MKAIEVNLKLQGVDNKTQKTLDILETEVAYILNHTGVLPVKDDLISANTNDCFRVIQRHIHCDNDLVIHFDIYIEKVIK